MIVSRFLCLLLLLNFSFEKENADMSCKVSSLI